MPSRTQPVSEWCCGIAGHEGRFGGMRHALTARLHWTFGEARIPAPGSRNGRTFGFWVPSARRVNISSLHAARYIQGRKEARMAKTLIEIDDEYLAAAQQALGTATKKDTVNAALREVTALAARRRDLQRLTSHGLPDLEDQDVMRAAWQR
jgi:Arc/MetJ family transcription regulator